MASRNYTREEMMAMQKDAERRVREMQERSKSLVANDPPPPPPPPPNPFRRKQERTALRWKMF